MRIECYRVSLAPVKEAAEELMKKLKAALGSSLRRKVSHTCCPATLLWHTLEPRLHLPAALPGCPCTLLSPCWWQHACGRLHTRPRSGKQGCCNVRRSTAVAVPGS